MKLNSKLLLSVIVLSAPLGAKLPDFWVSAIDKIEVAVDGMEDALNNDANLYKTTAKTVSSLSQIFKDSGDRRKEVLDCFKEKV